MPLSTICTGCQAGAKIGATGAFLPGVVGALFAPILIWKIMISFMVGTASIMIAPSRLDASTENFLHWRSATTFNAFYPQVITGELSTNIGMGRSLMEELG